MRITILTLFPDMFKGFCDTSIIKRAIDNDVVEINIVDFRKYSLDKNNKVDDYPYGGGAGMVLMCQPVIDCLQDVRKDNSVVLLTSPVGRRFNQDYAKELKENDDVIIICGHYEGYDERIDHFVDQKVSIGDYVLTGGELAAMVITDTITRLLEGAISKQSLDCESFDDNLLEYPQYTRPEEYQGLRVPDVLLSGHHQNIAKWRLKQSLKATYKQRKDLLAKRELTSQESDLLVEALREDDLNG